MAVYNYFTIRNGHIIEEYLTLFQAGPLISVEISIPNALASLYQKMNAPIPPPKTGYALIDTGCMTTSVDDATVNSLGVRPVGLGQTLTASGPATQNKYPAHVKFPGTNIEIDYNSVLSVNLKDFKFNGQPIIALIGRDILANCIFIYNGKTGMYSFAH